MSNRPVIVDIKDLPWDLVPAVFEILHEQAKARLKDDFDIYEVTENVDIPIKKVSSEIISRKDYDMYLSKAYFRYYGFDEDNDLIFREDLDGFAPSMSRDDIVQEVVTWKELLNISEVEVGVPPTKEDYIDSIAQQLFKLSKTGVSGTSMVKAITQLASDTKHVLPNASCFTFKEDQSSIHIKVVRRTDAVVQHTFSLKPFVTYPHYRLFPSGMIVYKTEATVGMIVKVASNEDTRQVGQLLSPLQPDEGKIVELKTLGIEVSYSLVN